MQIASAEHQAAERARAQVPAPEYEEEEVYVIKALLGYRKTDPTPLADRPLDEKTGKPRGPARKFIEWESWGRKECTG